MNKQCIEEAKRLIEECIKTQSPILSLSVLKLTKFPKSIRKCTHITTLVCYNNQLTKIPHCFKKLQNLNCRNNQLTKIPYHYSFKYLRADDNNMIYPLNKINTGGLSEFTRVTRPYILKDCKYTWENHRLIISIIKCIIYIQRLYKKYLFLIDFYSVF